MTQQPQIRGSCAYIYTPEIESQLNKIKLNTIAVHREKKFNNVTRIVAFVASGWGVVGCKTGLARKKNGFDGRLEYGVFVLSDRETWILIYFQPEPP